MINRDIYAEVKPKPYKVETDAEEVADKCELCLELPCCPEHCCDVSSIHETLLMLRQLLMLIPLHNLVGLRKLRGQ